MLNKPTILRDGTWLLPVAMWKDKAHGCGVVRSCDRGASFEWIGGTGPGTERMIVERSDGALWMLIRKKRAKGGADGIVESVSTDGGATWSAPTDSPIEGPGARFFLGRLNSGRLLLVNRYGYRKTGHPILEQRSHLTALLSEDDGRTWPYRLLLDRREDVSYPDAVEAPDGRLYIIYDRGRYGDREILMAVVSEKDILAGKAGPDTRLRAPIDKATRPRGGE